MARYKPYNLKQDKWIPLSYADQILPGSFEYALNEIVEEHLDLTGACGVAWVAGGCVCLLGSPDLAALRSARPSGD
jgi:hypothetical protein